MSSVYFNQFELLWKRVEEKFTNECRDTFTLETLQKLLISRGLLTNLTTLTSIENKFLNYKASDKKPPSVNLSDTIFKALYNYLEIRGIPDLQESINNTYVNSEEIIAIVREEATKPSAKKNQDVEVLLSEIGFLGREEELTRLIDFIQSPDSNIFALYGVPMIGKTTLVNQFIGKIDKSGTEKKYKVISVKLNSKPENAEQKIKNEVFLGKEFNDFSDISSYVIIVIQNFEETLNWVGNPRDLHDIKEKYVKIKEFLIRVSEINSVKLILESRFQIHFQAFLPDWKKKVKTLLPKGQLEGIERDEFWRFYQSKGFTYPQFESLCNNFDNHTGLLALAFNDAEFLFQNRLIEAFYQPKIATRYLWDLVEHIIDRLEDREVIVLCAMTFLQEPVKKESLYNDFLSLPEFNNELDIDDAFFSLTNKLLIQMKEGLYDLNSYIREVCYTFLRQRKRIKMMDIENLPYFKENGYSPSYDEIYQAQERGDYGRFYNLIHIERGKGNFQDVIEILEYVLQKDPIINKINVLDEIGITYKVQGNWKEAIKILERAKTLKSNNPHTLNELGICYREDGQWDKAIENLQTSVGYGNIPSYNELAICYKKIKDYKNAISVAEKAIERGDYKIYSVLVDIYLEIDELEKAYQVVKKGVEASKGNDDILNKQLQKIIDKMQKSGLINMEKSVILFLAANPNGSTLRLDQEMREVENQLLRIAKNRDTFIFNKEVATRISDLQQRLLDQTPDFVHFSGHGSDSGIYLTDNQGNYQLVRGEALANLFNLFADKIRCVFLNSCYSESQANEINKFIPFVIGMKEAVPDDVAIQFAISFYQAIASGRDIEFAFNLAKNSVELNNLSGSDIPVLLKGQDEFKKVSEQQKSAEKEAQKLKVFLSYSHKDEDIKEELNNHLSALKRSEKISTWDDRELPVGAEWDKAIKAELENADIVLLLISANFIASHYIWNVEIKKAIEKHGNGTAVVIPIFCKTCDFGDMPFAKLQGLPKDAKFIASQSDKDHAYTEVAKGIRKIVEARLD